MRAYVPELAGSCVTHVLSLVRALFPTQDMEPFVTGNVEGVADIDYLALGAQVAKTMEAILEGLDF